MKFSILVPVYNVEKYLSQCVESLLDQSFEGEYEIILVDDGSTDSSGKICDEYSKNHPDKIKVIHKENKGLVSARQAGIAIAEGEYSLFVDSDDFAEKNLLKTVNNCIDSNANPDMVIYSFRYYSNGKTTERKATLASNETVFTADDKKELYKSLITTNFITSLWTKALKTEILKKDPTDYSLYYDRNMAEDWFRSIHLLTAADKIVYINEPLYNYRTNEESISRSFRPETIGKKNTLYVYDRFTEYLPTWGMNTEEYRQKLNARWLNEVTYTFKQYYEHARNAKERKAVVDFDWDSMLPEGAKTSSDNPFENPANRKLYELIKNKKYRHLHLMYVREKAYKKLREIKARLLKNKDKKNTVFLIKVMLGGGAERVISLLSSAAEQNGNNVTLIITHQSKSEAVLENIDSRINVVSLPDELKSQKYFSFISKIIMLFARLAGKAGFKEKSLVMKYLSRNYGSVKWLKEYFIKHKISYAVAFLYDSIFLALLAKNKTTKVIISERGDPQQSTGSKTTMALIKNLFPLADDFVFQSPDVQKWYEQNTPVRGKVIFNPIKSDLPEPYSGERKKRIVNFCRISAQKNLIMLVDTFAEFHKDFPDYELDIIGDPVGNNADGYIDSVVEHIRKLGCENCIHILPAIKDIHSVIKDYAMFVSSSDFEGMSNSMLEAMAMGLPCVCTDCPAGGARAVIKDGENGILTPVGDSHALYLAMKKVAENPHLANKLSQSSVKIRKEQSVEKIIKEWMELING